MDMIEVEKIQRLTVEPGETLVITLPNSTTAEDADRIAAVVRERMPEGVNVLLVSGEVRLGVVGGATA